MVGVKENGVAAQAKNKLNRGMCTVKESAQDMLNTSLAKIDHIKDSGISRLDQLIKNIQNRMENSPPFRHFMYILVILAALPVSVLLLCSGLVIGCASLASFVLLAAVVLVTFLVAMLALSAVLAICGLLAGGTTAIVYSAFATFFILSMALRNIYSFFGRSSSKLPPTQPKTD